MSNNNSKLTTGPLQELFSDISKILEFMEVKDQNAADNNETVKSRSEAELYLNAITENDDYITYHHLWNTWMFKEVVPNAKTSNIRRWMEKPFTVPNVFRENLRIKGREAFLNSYQESNNYYRMINGMPSVNTPESDFIYMSIPMRNQLHASDEPIHMLSPIIQNSYMSTDEYKQAVEDNSDKKYLKYLGMYKIDPFTARKAKDFDIIRYPANRSDINPNLLTEFARIYNDYREYVMVTLYNRKLEDLYVNYRNFMGLLIMICTLLQINNKATEMLHSKQFLDDSVIYEILSMYRIPNSLLLTNETRRRLVSRIYKLIQEKGTDNIYDEIINILQYDDVKINKLLLMKGQQIDKVGPAEPYFLQVDINDKDPYDTISRGDAKRYEYNEITDPDPTWWNDDDTKRILQEYEYTASDSKYITVETGIPQMKYLMEAIYFSRLILDNKAYTDEFLIEVPELFGTEMVSLYDLMVFIISATCMNYGVSGKIITETEEPTATAGFNFDIDWDAFMDYVNNAEHVDKDRVMSFMENLTVRTPADVTRIYNDVIEPMRAWLEYKITYADDRHEYTEYENIYRALYTYDITRNLFMDDYRLPMENICAEYGISEEEMLMYKHFYPRKFSGQAIQVDEFVASRYYPFINRINEIDWYIHVELDTENGTEDRGYVYFHDILNSRDLRELTNPNGTRVFMDYEDSNVGWVINNKAVDKALELIDRLNDDALKDAYMVIDTPVIGSEGKSFDKESKLPLIIRSHGMYKKILHDKLLRDMQGLANPPETYREYLYRKSPKLYNVLTKDDRFNRDKDSWLNDVRRIAVAVETELNIHLKYFEQSVLGTEAFFKPLITLINRFKSTFVRIAKTSVKHTFDDKIDAGGNSNMLKLFDEANLVIHFVTLMNSGYEAQLGLFDTIGSLKHHIVLRDFSNMMRNPGNRTKDIGSIRMSDEIKLFMNGKELDPSGSSSYWVTGDPGTCRWSEEDEILMKTRTSNTTIHAGNVDHDGWKNFTE